MRVDGYLTTSGTGEQAVEATTYTEQSAGAQRSFKSSSASDAAAGTGVRQVTLTYFTLASGVIAGPFTETVILNGTTAVATVATNIALVEKIEAVACGSGGVAAGTISLYAAADGTGTVIASIATGDRRTYYAHHYVPSGQRVMVTEIMCASQDASSTTSKFIVRAQSYPSANVPETALTVGVVAQGGTGTRSFPLNPGYIVSGPARIRTYVTPATTSVVHTAALGLLSA